MGKRIALADGRGAEQKCGHGGRLLSYELPPPEPGARGGQGVEALSEGREGLDRLRGSRLLGGQVGGEGGLSAGEGGLLGGQLFLQRLTVALQRLDMALEGVHERRSDRAFDRRL